jgi:hypothetical protein
MDQTTPLFGLLADLLARFDVETVVAKPMADDFQDTVPVNYRVEESRGDE